MRNAIVTICTKLVAVTQRQLADFLDGSFSSALPAEISSKLAHCPLTNLIGESAFGDFDFDVHKRRNCTLFNRSSIHMSKRNDVVDFIASKTSNERDKLFKFSRSYAPCLKKRKVEEEDKVKIQIQEKMI